jgi:hypothetical protein
VTATVLDAGASAADAGLAGPASGALFESAAEFTFKGDLGNTEQFPPRHDDDVEARREFVATEDLPNQSLCTIPDDRSAKLPCCRDPKPTFGQTVREPEQRERPPVHLRTAVVDTPVLDATSDSFVPVKSLHRSAHSGVRRQRVSATRC